MAKQNTRIEKKKKTDSRLNNKQKKNEGKEDKLNIPPPGKSQSPLVYRRPKEPGNGNE
jgi:hypothetical protein